MDLLLLWAMVKVRFEGMKKVGGHYVVFAVGYVDLTRVIVRASVRLLDACLEKGTVRRAPEAE